MSVGMNGADAGMVKTRGIAMPNHTRAGADASAFLPSASTISAAPRLRRRAMSSKLIAKRNAILTAYRYSV
jgi:hypothetical protein